LFSGTSIDNASSKEGKSYSALPNAFRYRKELVAGCTCNGKDVIGLANIKAEDDKTLRRGDMVASKGGLEVVNYLSDGRPSFAAASKVVQSRFERPPSACLAIRPARDIGQLASHHAVIGWRRG
jgi:hypothetical protein